MFFDFKASLVLIAILMSTRGAPGMTSRSKKLLGAFRASLRTEQGRY